MFGTNLTTEEVIGLLGVTRETLSRWKRAGKLNPVKIGKRNYFKRKEIEKEFGIKINDDGIEDVEISLKKLDREFRKFGDTYSLFKEVVKKIDEKAEEYFDEILKKHAEGKGV